MMPWWGVMIVCIVFCIWSVFCMLLGAAIMKTGYDKKRMSLEDTLRKWEHEQQND